MTSESIGIPVSFLRETLPAISNHDELLVSLSLFRLIGEAGSQETPIAEIEIIQDGPLREALKARGAISELDARIFDGLELAVGRNSFLRFLAIDDEQESAWYLANTTVNRALVLAMIEGRIPAPKPVWHAGVAPRVIADPPNIFRLYEQNIGPLTPMIADQLTIASGEFPASWIEEAMSEAVSYNRRNWRYILRILENWRQSGRQVDS